MDVLFASPIPFCPHSQLIVLLLLLLWRDLSRCVPTFEKFIIYDVLPSMNPFPGPRSVFILDNCRIHKSQLLYRIARFSVTVIFVAVAVNFLSLSLSLSLKLRVA
jgi:hypothetical protein